MADGDSKGFLKLIKGDSNVRVPLPTSVEGVTGEANIANLWRTHYKDVFNTADEGCRGANYAVCNDMYTDIQVSYDELSSPIDYLDINKSRGLDGIYAEQSKHSFSSDLADAKFIPPACDEWDGSVRFGDEWDGSGPSGGEYDGTGWSGHEWDGSGPSGDEWDGSGRSSDEWDCSGPSGNTLTIHAAAMFKRMHGLEGKYARNYVNHDVTSNLLHAPSPSACRSIPENET